MVLKIELRIIRMIPKRVRLVKIKKKMPLVRTRTRIVGILTNDRNEYPEDGYDENNKDVFDDDYDDE